VITYINKSNARKYRELFDKASAVLGITNDEEKISSLEEYFSVIKTLVETTGDKKYTMLPLDEDVFEIDANKRLITVPSSFKANGISVQGDQIAEVVYFKIDRFFDATDLNEMDIFIQWQAPNGDQGISKEWVRDIESENGKLIFGWPLSEEITVKAGNVKFAVRFVKFDKSDKEKVVYSFSTLTAEAPIKPALDFDLKEGAVQYLDYSKEIIERLVNSKVDLPGAGTSERPDITLTLKEITDLIAVEGGEGGEVALHVQARSQDAGNITYAWKYYALEYDSKSGEYVLSDVADSSERSEIVYLQTEDKEIKSDKDYYLVYVEDNKTVIHLATTQDWAAYIDSGYAADKITTIYERFCEFIAKDIGVYTVSITNKRGKASRSTIPDKKLIENEDGDSILVDETFEEYGLITLVPAPAAPTVSNIRKDNKDGEEIDHFVIAEPGAEAVVLEGGIIPPEKVVLFAEAEAEDEGYGVLSYQWIKNDVDIEGAINDKIEVAEEGDFALKVFNTRNFHTRNVRNEPCRVSYPPINPQLHVEDINHPIGEPISANAFVIPGTYRADYEELLPKFAYQWYKENASNELIKIEGATSESYTPDKGGIYEVEIFSIYNGEKLVSGTMSNEIKVITPDD
jgi:hypothetical protein